MIIHHRYPSNTLLAALSGLILLEPWLSIGILSILLIVNWPFFQYIGRHCNWRKSISIFPLSLMEGFAFGFGITFGLWRILWKLKK